VNNELSELGSLFSNFSYASGSVFTNLNVNVFKAVENSWENLGLNDNFSEVNSMLGNLGEALADVTLELSVWVRN